MLCSILGPCQSPNQRLVGNVWNVVLCSRPSARIARPARLAVGGSCGISVTQGSPMFNGTDQQHYPVFCFTGRVCVYCGDVGETHDHIIAVAEQHSVRRRHIKRLNETSGPWAWSCSDCNNHLSSRFFTTFQERHEFANIRLCTKAKPIEWHEWELSDMDYCLRDHIVNSTAKRKWMQFRADWQDSRDFYLNLEPLLWHYLNLQPDLPRHDYLLRYFKTTIEKLKGLYSFRKDSWG